ncbi:hypothetical protein E2562_022028 [Oryza meyeriana var. granulata]|uniref:Uncharacterized protein n=1 Tax=Oryza meyeriana var. granulata TaxID=110450 RepID=A0A6G1ENJ8_9ORYZ|nr:hypothetical protein E2562_022028 [Oryza meyeriana var. granulata]
MEGMDAVADGMRAPRSGCGRDGAAPTPSLSAQREEEGKGAAAVAGEGEQVERFYALLAKIRAMRGMYRDAAAAAAVATTGGDVDGEDCLGGPSRKRARRAEPPWRPAFRMEDFQEAAGDDAACSRKKQRVGYGATAAKRRTEKEAAAAADDDDEEGEVVQGKEHWGAASLRAGPLTS